jgi:hypothetical protein
MPTKFTHLIHKYYRDNIVLPSSSFLLHKFSEPCSYLLRARSLSPLRLVTSTCTFAMFVPRGSCPFSGLLSASSEG